MHAQPHTQPYLLGLGPDRPHTAPLGLSLQPGSQGLVYTQCMPNPTHPPNRPYSAPTRPEPASRGPTWPILASLPKT